MVKHVDSGGQVHLVTNIRKPRKWRRYEYLQSSGTQYIDTGVFLISGHILLVELEGNYVNTYSTKDVTFGWDYGGLIGRNNNTGWTLDSNATTSNVSTTIKTNIILTINTVDHISKCIYKNSGSSETTLRDNSSIMTYATAGYPLFRAKNKLDFYSSSTAFKLYSCKIYNNNILVRDFVPAQYNGQYGMWDLVEDKFYKNAGTGTFTVGPEVKNYDEIDEVRKTSSLLPAGVELYDYILSSGTLYIKMGTTFDDTSTFEMKIKRGTTSNNASSLIGYRQPNAATINGNIRFIFIYSNGLVGMRFGTKIDNSSSSLDTNSHILTFDGINLKSDGTTIDSVTGKYSTSDYQESYLFNCNATYTNDVHPFVGSIYYCKFYKNGILVRNFLPCTYLGEPGMWDTVENKFYRNQGTGLFTLGNKIVLKEYEYLKTVSTNLHIDTGIILEDGHSLAYDLIFKYEATGVRRLMGTNSSITSYFGVSTNNKYEFGSINADLLVGNIDHIYEKYDLVNYRRYSYVNNIKYIEHALTSAGAVGDCFIFSLRNNYTGAGLYFYSGQILYDDKVVRDFIPVSYNGTPGLWDKVEWKFYANAGSGSFTLGPEKASGVYPVRRTLIDEQLFTFRQTAGGLKVMKPIAKLNGIKGNSVAWNQHIYTTGSSGSFKTYNSDGSITLNGTSTGWNSRIMQLDAKMLNGHTYYLYYEYISGTISVASGASIGNYYDGYQGPRISLSINNYKQHLSSLYKRSTESSQLTLGLSSGNQTVTFTNLKFYTGLIDLTIIYGLGNEPTTVAQFEADYFKWFGKPLTYEPYDPGSIKNTKISALVTIGFNQWDEQWEKGAYNDNGEKISNNTTIRSKYLIKVFPNTAYCLSHNNGRVMGYDAQGIVIKRISMSLVGNVMSTFTTPSNCYYIAYNTESGYGNTYKDDICINISNPDRNGTYKPYNEQTYPIPITSITGKLNGSGNSVVVFPNGMKSTGFVHDEILVENGVTKAIQRVGTYTITSSHNVSWGSWKSGSGVYFFPAAEANRIFNGYPECKSYAKLKCNLLDYISYISNGTETATTWGISHYADTSAKFVLSLPNITTSTAVNTWISNHGKLMINYPLKTPREYILDNFSLPLDIKVERGGTEEIISTDSNSVGPTLQMKYTL